MCFSSHKLLQENNFSISSAIITPFIGVEPHTRIICEEIHILSVEDDNHLPYSCMLSSLVDPPTSSLEHERIERQAEEFKLFVFKHYPEDSRQA